MLKVLEECQMYKPKLEKEIRCPLEYGLAIFGGKWNSRIICVLAEKHILRYSEIRNEMTDITDAVLAATLKNLISDGIVRREQYNEIPPKVEYSLTDKGKSVVPILQSICRWSGAYHKNENDPIMAQCQKCDYKNK
jgi:DNA-binding HxlR family transcriptional regulator